MIFMNATLKNITAMLIFGSIGLFVAHIELASSQIALVRGFVGAFILFIAMVCLHKKINRNVLIKNLRYLLISGVAIGFNWIFLFQAYNYTTIATATLTYYLAPTFVVLLSPFILKESLSLFKIICVILSLLGMALVAGIFNDNQSGVNDFIGVLYGISAALFYAIVVLANKFFKDISAIDSSIAQLLLASIIFIALCNLSGKFMEHEWFFVIIFGYIRHYTYRYSVFIIFFFTTRITSTKSCYF